MTAYHTHVPVGIRHPQPAIAVYLDMRVWARSRFQDELSWAEANLAVQLAAVPDQHADVEDPDLRANSVAFAEFDIGERLRAVRDELAVRLRHLRGNPAERAAFARETETWADLAREVRQRTNVVALLQSCGIDLRRVGRDSRRHGSEWAGPCPVCRDGVDRLRAWDGVDGLAWCRQCGWSADAIAVARSFVPGCDGFREAVSYLAEAALITKAVPA